MRAQAQQAGELLLLEFLSPNRTPKDITYGEWTWEIIVKRSCTDARQNTDAHALFALSQQLRAAFGVQSTPGKRPHCIKHCRNIFLK